MKCNFRLLFLCLILVPLLISGCGNKKGGGGLTPPKPDPDPSSKTPPKSLVYDHKDDEVVVEEVKPNGEVVFDAKAPTDRIPKIGEVIVSGSTDVAPQGFLYKITGIRKEGDKIIAITEEASLTDVIEECDTKMPIPSDQIRVNRILGPDGNEIPFAETRAAKDGITIGAIDLKMGWQIDISDGWDNVTSDKIKKIGFKTLEELEETNKSSTKSVLELYTHFKSEPYLNFILKISDWEIQKCGLEAQYDLACQMVEKIAYQSTSSTLFEINLFSIFCEPITIMVGVIPVVFTPEFKIVAKIDTKGEVRAIVRSIDAKVKVHGSLVWHREIPEGENSHFSCKYGASDTVQQPEIGIPKNMNSTSLLSDNIDLSIQGSVKAGVDVSILSGLFNSNKHLNARLGMYLYLEGTAGINLLKLWESLDGMGFKVFAGMDFTPRMKIPYVKDSYLDTKVTLFRKEIAHFILTQEFGEMSIRTTPEHIIVGSEINSSVLKTTILPTRDIGFAISQVTSTDDPKAWEYYSAYDHFDKHKGDILPFSIECKIPLKTPGTYYIRPYLKVGYSDAPLLVFRKAKAVKINSNGSIGNIEDVPGYGF